MDPWEAAQPPDTPSKPSWGSTKDEATGRRKRKHFQWLTNNVGYPKLREHLGAVVAIMKLSTDWHDFRAKLDKLHPARWQRNCQWNLPTRRKPIPVRVCNDEAAN
jgi:hypothetical protein